MRRSFLSTAVLAGALVLGCSEQADVAALNPNGSESTPITRANASANAVSRFTDFVGDFLIDETRQLSAMIGRSYETLVSVCTGGEDAPDTGLIQVVERPNGGVNVLVRAAEVNILVWDVVLPPDDCDLFLANPPFATGTSRLSVRVTDPGPDGNGASNFSVRHVGTVTSGDTGQRYHFLFTGHIVVTVSGQVHFFGGDIKLTPIGG
jgi:hypothetical protein